MLGVKLQKLRCVWEDLRNAKERGPDPTAQFASIVAHLQS